MTLSDNFCGEEKDIFWCYDKVNIFMVSHEKIKFYDKTFVNASNFINELLEILKLN